MPRHKITLTQRAELRMLHQEGRTAEMKVRATELGVSPYYGAVLAGRSRHPKRYPPTGVKRRRWQRAAEKGPVLA